MRRLYLRNALTAVEHVREKLPLGASNRPDNPHVVSAGLAVNKARAEAGELIHQSAQSPGKAIARTAFNEGGGNCGEQAEMAFQFLKDMGISPIELWAINPNRGDHAFVIIGRPAAASDRWMDNSWGDAVICDPWANIVQAVADDDEIYGTRLECRKRWARTTSMDI